MRGDRKGYTWHGMQASTLQLSGTVTKRITQRLGVPRRKFLFPVAIVSAGNWLMCRMPLNLRKRLLGDKAEEPILPPSEEPWCSSSLYLRGLPSGWADPSSKNHLWLELNRKQRGSVRVDLSYLRTGPVKNSHKFLQDPGSGYLPHRGPEAAKTKSRL